jgi:hypothetical protein
MRRPVGLPLGTFDQVAQLRIWAQWEDYNASRVYRLAKVTPAAMERYRASRARWAATFRDLANRIEAES